MSAKGYLLLEMKVSDPAAMARYRELAEVAVRTYGGRFLIRGGAAEVLEGRWSPPERLVVIEFDSVEQARTYYHSPEYQAARAARCDACEMNMLVVGGVDASLN